MHKTIQLAAADNAAESIVQFGADKETNRDVHPPPEPPPESPREIELDIRPPPEPPPESPRAIKLDHILESLHPDNRDAYVESRTYTYHRCIPLEPKTTVNRA
jgi:hypothetical protein